MLEPCQGRRRERMTKKITLVIPPSVFLLDERVFMSLGILKVAAVLEHAGYRVDLIDLSGVKNYLDVVRIYASSTDSHVFGITTTTPQLPAACEIAKTIRSSCDGVRVILGGPHVTLVHAAVKREKRLGLSGSPARAIRAEEKLLEHFDALIAGDGEVAIFPALSGHSSRIIDADDPRSSLFLTNERLTALPFPARHLIDVSSYRYTIDDERALSLIAQLGCPFECGFCGGRQSPSLRRVRMRTSENVVGELIELYDKYGVRGMMFYDDELNVNREMVELMKMIRHAQEKRRVEWRLRGFIKAQLFTDEQAEAMFAAGFRWILVGFESGSPRILENINKRSTREENTRCVEIARRHGLKVKALLSLGHPGESSQTVADTYDWLLKSRPDDFDISIITTYPGTPYYDFAVPHAEIDGVWVYTYDKTGDHLFSYEIDHTAIADYYKGIPGEYRAYVYTDHLSAEELVRLRDQVESDVRSRLGIPFNPSTPSILYEHTMGQQSPLPPSILRKTRS